MPEINHKAAAEAALIRSEVNSELRSQVNRNLILTGIYHQIARVAEILELEYDRKLTHGS